MRLMADRLHNRGFVDDVTRVFATAPGNEPCASGSGRKAKHCQKRSVSATHNAG